MSKKSLTKTQFLDEYADRLNHELELSLKRKDANVVIEELQNLLCKHATDERGIKIPGFLKVAVIKTKERMGRNPATGKKIKIESKIKGKVTLLKAMKERLAEIGENYFNGKSSKKEKSEKKSKKDNIIKIKLDKKNKKKNKKLHKKAA